MTLQRLLFKRLRLTIQYQKLTYTHRPFLNQLLKQDEKDFLRRSTQLQRKCSYIIAAQRVIFKSLKLLLEIKVTQPLKKSQRKAIIGQFYIMHHTMAILMS